MDMSESVVKSYPSCPRQDIPVYLDGELSTSEELLFEEHINDCTACLDELNNQKRLFSSLNLAFDNGSDLEMPVDFAKVVAVRAESNVGGLRKPGERKTALIVAGLLLFFALIALGGNFETGFGFMNALSEKALAMAGFAGHTIYDLATGAAVISRTLTRQVLIDFYIPAFGGLAILTVLMIRVFRHPIKNGR